MKVTPISGLLALAIAAAAIPCTASAAQADMTVRGVSVTPQQGQSDPVRRFIVNYRDGSLARRNPAAAQQAINRALSRSGVAAQALGGGSVTYLRKLATGHDLFKLPKAVDRATANALMQQIAADRDVVSVAVDEMKQIVAPRAIQPAAFPDDPPDDPRYASHQWNFHAPNGDNSNIDGVVNRSGVNVAEAWKLADGEGIVIAVIDTGITAHPDLDTSLADAGYDFISDGFVSGRATDDRAPGGWDLGNWTIGYPGAEGCAQGESIWHGTHVAGTAGAERTNNAMGLAGIAPAAKVLPVRVLGHCGGYDSDIADAIVWAAGGSVPGVPANAHPAQVINMSLGGGGTCPSDNVVALAIAEANARGTAVIAAAGNSNQDAAGFSPASCAGAITVGATGISSARAPYSNHGPRVDIAAPGGDGSAQQWTAFIAQAYNFGETTPVPLEAIDPVTDYAGMTGTSMAAPHVAGVVALMQSARLKAGLPLLTPNQVLTYLQQTVTPFAVAPPANRLIGAGIVNAAAAVTRALCVGDDCAPDAPPPEILKNRIPVRGLAGGTRTWVLDVPQNAKGPLNISTSGGTGDLTLLVHFAAAPEDAADWQQRSARRGNNETIRIRNPQPGQYFIRLLGQPRVYQNVVLQASHN